MTRSGPDQLLLGEWACLGILYPAPAHGFAIAARLKPAGDVGRVWSLSRPLTYRALDQLSERNHIRPVATEPGAAGPSRTILAPTRTGRARFRTWLHTPVEHLRDLRSELLLKLVLADICDIDVTDMLRTQRTRIGDLADAMALDRSDLRLDPVALWRQEASHAALRFLDQLLSPVDPRPTPRE